MYLVQFYYGKVSYTWEECFPTLISAVRFGMRMYRECDNITSFRTIYYEPRDRDFLKFW